MTVHHPPRPSRRTLLGGALAGLAGLSLPRHLLAGARTDRRFLFVYCDGGWDPTFVFAPLFGASTVSMPENSSEAEIGGLALVDSPDRPDTRAFFERWGPRACVLNGLEIPSVTHERCRQILLTGDAESGSDDWPSTLAAETGGDLRLPCVVSSGPGYTSSYTSSVVRLGDNGQVRRLLDGSTLAEGDRPMTPPPDAVQAAVDARLDARLRALAADGGAVGDFAAAQQAVMEKRIAAADDLAEVALESFSGARAPLGERAQPLLTCFENDLTRCAVIKDAGRLNQRWDSHGSIGEQTGHYEDMFRSLNFVMSELSSRRGPAGGSLLDETTVIVFSEMGRTPGLNSMGGKDHWTWTSALLLGAGIAGGQVLGAYDDGLVGVPIDLATGAYDPAGTVITAAHLGATLLALAGLDPALYRPGIAPITGALR